MVILSNCLFEAFLTTIELTQKTYTTID
ncbi:uncharacterized protein METZ01_LOCUS454756 [marine metagenome]|uniref:Uncharacterized protein n=1 Tax=marine metagenome TaxID=408172 RepID=A0A383A2C2_9ZZZZ